MFCAFSSHCQCLAHSFFFVSQRSIGLTSSSSFFRICTPHLHAVGLVILCKSPIRTLDHVAHFFQLLHLIFFLHLSQPVVPFLHGIFPSCMEPSFFAVRSQQLSNPPTVVSIHSFFCSHFLRHILQNLYSPLSFHLFLRCAFMHTLQTLQVKLSEPGENSCPAIFSALSCSVLPASSYAPHSKKEPLPLCAMFCCLPPCTCPGPLPQSSLQASSNIHPTPLDSLFSNRSSPPCLPPKNCLACSSSF